MAPLLEVLVELPPHGVDGTRGAQDPAARQPGETVELTVGICVERDSQEPLLGRRDEQRTDRRVDDVEAGVEQAGPRGGLAEAAIEVGGNGHPFLLARSRRTPVDAAWRAATGLDSSAAAICS